MSGEQSDNQLPQSDDLTDVDLYCLHCGYNLRGLSGDPRRCPECGQFSPLGEAAVPGPFLRRSQRRLRAPPSLCVVDGFFCILGLCGGGARFVISSGHRGDAWRFFLLLRRAPPLGTLLGEAYP